MTDVEKAYEEWMAEEWYGHVDNHFLITMIEDGLYYTYFVEEVYNDDSV